MTQEAANVIDLNAYRARRGRHSPPVPAMPSDIAQVEWVLAVPVLMPIAIAWFPIWSIASVPARLP